MEEGRNQKDICHNPCKGTGKAGSQIAQRGNQRKGDDAAGKHFHDTGNDGEDGKAHSLNEKPHDINQSQWKIEATLDK